MFGAKQDVTTVAAGMKIVGTVTADGAVQIEGELEGEVRCGSLVVARGGKIKGPVSAESIVVDGLVEGPIQASEITLKSEAHVLGDIACQTVAIEKGAFIEGKLQRASGANAAASFVEPARPISGPQRAANSPKAA